MTMQLTNVPQNLAAFRTTGDLTRDDYENVVFPSAKELLQKTGILNYLRPSLPILTD
ncbi:hypothetical protein [Pinibacter aurantiacus]|uniref:Uncharacterized protein n=1 Tax=Pinibacter aurantiacus TaxID=2851599 RepID=A0A9E2W5C2_9BACT|nr:hypothetical protein [Pinibacter aurantiacus]MBV4358503.1 hypothetical protein [Pinibacter aurantiacus]